MRIGPACYTVFYATCYFALSPLITYHNVYNIHSIYHTLSIHYTILYCAIQYYIGIVKALDFVFKSVKASPRRAVVSMSLGGPCDNNDCTTDIIVQATEV